MRPFAPRAGERRGAGARVRCVLKRRWCRIVENGLQSRYDSCGVGGVISPRGDRQQAPRRPKLLRRSSCAPARNRFGLHRLEPVGRGFVQPRCI
jgi:hypothetical protein